MRIERQLGFDELMIVNPSTSRPKAMFLSEDGNLYQADGLSLEHRRQRLEQCFLGADGFVYQLQGIDEEELTEFGGEAGECFLGWDGALYEIVQ